MKQVDVIKENNTNNIVKSKTSMWPHRLNWVFFERSIYCEKERVVYQS